MGLAVVAPDVPVPAALAGALTRLAADLGVPVSAPLLAAHAAVLSALTGERAVVTGLRSGVSPPVPCRLVVDDGPWRDLILRAHQTHDEPPGGPPAETPLDRSGPPAETMLDLSGEPAATLPGGVVLSSAFLDVEGRLSLRLSCLPPAGDGTYADRVAGYYLTALRLMTADPDAHPYRQSLLSAAERRLQLHRLAGPHRELPDRRFHELFEERVRAHPDLVAAVCGARSWTYDELNRRANRIGRALLARGLRPEDVVAVVTERDLDWLAAVLAVVKAGGAYLPIEPAFPAERIATTLTQSGCRLVLTRARYAANLDRALPAAPHAEPLDLDAIYAEAHPDTDLGVAVGADQLAYIYFTSGSTGRPKGAMCEHAGMLNHLYAKIDDLGIGAGQVVAQTAPQCFDISLWQLAAALLVGGRTLIVEQDAVLDVERYLDTVVAGDVEVLQVVPSFLEVVLAHLDERPRHLGRLRCVSATGEALKKELVARWFARYPEIALVNAYGLTETSDDTNHEVMREVPAQDRVPLGRPVNNVSVYVVDEHLEPVPLGAPGEIVFSGVCVGRGYVNDEARTKAAFLADPHRPGQRLYRSGDFGRWLPGGKLEFLGRRDSQVKIRGFRIEIGEIENAMLGVPGIRDAAVVVTGEDPDRYLVAFYTAPEPLTDLSALLAGRLPEYMVPSALHRLDRLPLTGNGKIDRAALTRMAARSPAGAVTREPPRTPTERRLAAAWAEVLKVPVEQIGRYDHFYDRGGTSLAAMRAIVKLDRLFSLRDLARHPVLAELARAVDAPAVEGVADV